MATSYFSILPDFYFGNWQVFVTLIQANCFFVGLLLALSFFKDNVQRWLWDMLMGVKLEVMLEHQ